MTLAADRRTEATWRLRLLADVGTVIATSLDFDHRLRQVAALTIPDLADLCVIDLLDQDGSIRGVAAAASDPSLPARLEDLRRRHPLDPNGPHPVAQALREGTHCFLPTMDETFLSAIAAGDEHARLMHDAGYRSAVVMPLSARGHTFGAFSALRMRDREPHGQEDLTLMGEIARCTALALDNSLLYKRARHAEQRLEAMLGQLVEAVTVQDAAGRLVYVNEAAAKLLGRDTPEQILAAPPGAVFEWFELYDEQGRPVGPMEMPGRRILRGEPSEPMLTRSIARTTRQERWLLTKASALKDHESGELFAVNVIEDVTALKRNEVIQRFLSQASQILSTSLDYETTLQRVANLAVPEIADWCAVDLLDENGDSRSMAVAHVDSAKRALVTRLRDYRPEDLDPDQGLGRVLRTGEPVVCEEITDRMLVDSARDEEHLRLLREVGLRSVLIVPMRVGKRTIGALTFVSAESGRTFTVLDVPLGQAVADRAALAVEHARLYRNRAHIAGTLQHSLLPVTLPTVPGWVLAALYNPAGPESDVGGDFYDVFADAAGRWLALIGDVTGKGVEAAALTALVRHTSRAVADYEPAPARILGRVDARLQREPNLPVCSAICVRLKPGGVTLAIGGHPLPLKVHDGTVTACGEPGPLLGAFPNRSWTQAECELRPGDTLIFYTDGVTDTLGVDGERFGSERLQSLLCAHAELGPEQLIERVGEELFRFRAGAQRDDMAVLALQCQDC